MGRPRDDARRKELLTAAVRYTQQHGLFGLTLRPLADELGTSTRNLLHHFGSAVAVSRAGLADLESVEGISKAVAKKIYDHFHSDG